MVILAAAALGAVGYGTYRAGEEAVREGKKSARGAKLAGRIRGHQGDLKDKSKERQERMAELQAARSLSGGMASADSSRADSVRSSSSSNNLSTTGLRMQGVMSRLKEDDGKKKLTLKNPFGRNKK